MKMWPCIMEIRVKTMFMEQEYQGKGLEGVIHIMTNGTCCAGSAEPTCASLTVSLLFKLAMHLASMLPGSCKE